MWEGDADGKQMQMEKEIEMGRKTDMARRWRWRRKQKCVRDRDVGGRKYRKGKEMKMGMR